MEKLRSASRGLVTQNPIGIAGGLNLYGYANGDPISYSDPFGLSPICLAGAVSSAALGFGLSRFTGSGYGAGSLLRHAGLGRIGNLENIMRKLALAAGPPSAFGFAYRRYANSPRAPAIGAPPRDRTDVQTG